MDADESNDGERFSISEDVLIASSQPDADSIESLTSMELPSDFSSQIGNAFKVLKSVSENCSNNTIDNHTDKNSISDLNTLTMIDEQNFEDDQAVQAIICTSEQTTDTNYLGIDHIENTTQIGSTNNELINKIPDTDTMYTRSTKISGTGRNLRSSKILKKKHLPDKTKIMKNKCKPMQMKKPTRPANSIAPNTKESRIKQIHSKQTLNSPNELTPNQENMANSNNIDDSINNILIAPEIHKTHDGLDVIDDSVVDRISTRTVLENNSTDLCEIISENTSEEINNNRKTILMKAATDEDNDMFNNPIKLAKIIQESELKNANVTNIKVSKNSKTIVIQVKNEPTFINKLLNLKVLGKWGVKVYTPKREQYKYGVVSPIDTDLDMIELKEQIMNMNNIKIDNIERLNTKRNNTKIPSPTIKIAFIENMPTTLNIGYSVFKVRPYVFAPIQCYNCQRLGHTANYCKAKKRCLKCSGNHTYKDCKIDTQKCANCGNNHMANSRICQVIKKAYDVEYYKATGNTHSEAVNKSRIENNMNTENHGTNKANYRDVVLKSKVNITSNNTVSTKCTVGTQTTFLEAWTQTENAGISANYQKDIATQCGNDTQENKNTNIPVNDPNSFMETIKEFMNHTIKTVCEIMCMNLHNISEEKRKQIISTKLNKHFNTLTFHSNYENYHSDISIAEGVISNESGEDSYKEINKKKKRKKR